MAETHLTIDGEVETPLSLNRKDMAALPDELLVPDVSQIEPRRQGRAVQLTALLERAAPTAAATHLTLHASSDDFAASIPLEAVRSSGVLIFEIDGDAMQPVQGGPYRFLIPNAAACQTAELDACANVKFLDRIELTAGKGRDTR